MKYKDYNDNELIFYISENNEVAEDILYTKYKPLIVNQAFNLHKGNKYNGVDINDLIQAGFYGLDKAINYFNDNMEITFYTFARLCIKRKMYTFLNTNNRVKHDYLNNAFRFEYSVDSSNVLSFSPNSSYWLNDYTYEPELLFLNKERLEEVFIFIEYNFTPLEKEVFQLHLNGFSYNEISNQLSINDKSVDNTLQRIKEKLKPLTKT